MSPKDEAAEPNAGAPSEAEVEALRAQVAELQQQLATRPQLDATTPIAAPAGRRSGWWRPPVVVVLLLLATICAPAAVVARWTSTQVSDTDRYVQTVAPLASDPAVQQAITDQVTNAIFSRLDVQAITQQAVQALEQQGLPPAVATGLDALTGPLANGVQGFVHDQVARLVASQQFQDAWTAANRAAHAQLVAVLTGDTPNGVTVDDDTVSINLAAVIDAVKAELSQRGFTIVDRLPAVNASFVVLQGADIGKAQRAFALLNTLSTALPVIGVLFLVAGVWVSRHHRRTLLVGALCIAGSMLLLGAALNLARPAYLDALPSQIPQDAGAVIFDTVTATIRTMLRTVLALFLVVAAAAWISGDSQPAIGLRRGLSGGAAWLREGGARHGVETGPVGRFAGRYKTPLRILVVGLAALLYVAKDQPTAAFVIWLAVILVLLLAVIELVAVPPARAEVGESTDSAPPPSAPAPAA